MPQNGNTDVQEAQYCTSVLYTVITQPEVY